MKRGLVKFSEHPYAINWSDKNIKQPNEVALNSSKNIGSNVLNVIIVLIQIYLIL
jgi:hypothetical protein